MIKACLILCFYDLGFNSFVQYTLSRRKIHWVTTPRQQAIYRFSKDSVRRVLFDESVALIPDESLCDYCGGRMDTITQFDTNCKRLLLWSEIMKVSGEHSDENFFQFMLHSLRRFLMHFVVGAAHSNNKLMK